MDCSKYLYLSKSQYKAEVTVNIRTHFYAR